MSVTDSFPRTMTHSFFVVLEKVSVKLALKLPTGFAHFWVLPLVAKKYRDHSVLWFTGRKRGQLAGIDTIEMLILNID